MKWPPTAQDLEDMSVLPPELQIFLSYSMFGKEEKLSERQQRLISSIGQVC